MAFSGDAVIALYYSYKPYPTICRITVSALYAVGPPTSTSKTTQLPAHTRTFVGYEFISFSAQRRTGSLLS